MIVKDTVVNENIGTFTDWRMTLWGESIDASKAKPYPMPTEFDDDHDEDDDEHTTVPAIVGTTSISVLSSTTLSANPTDHIERPVNSKTSSGATVTSSATMVSATGSSSASSTGTASSTAGSTATSSPESFLPSPFPTFGVSARTQIWIYGAIAAILIFCIALSVFFCVWRRRRARTGRADYEFEMVNDEDVDGAGEPLNGEGVRRKRRGGELYDAFAGESDEEMFSEAEEGEYKDEPEEKTRTQSPPELSEKH